MKEGQITDDEISKPMRMKYWRELNEVEKIERMREQVHSLQSTVRFLEGEVVKLANHSHLDGKIVGPIRSEFGYVHEENSRSPNPEDVYF